MHVLTKIFIVLVTLLAVLLVPLVVVYAHNENSFQAKYQAEEDRAGASDQALRAAQASFGATLSRKDAEIQELAAANREMRRQNDRQESDIRSLESRLADAESNSAEIDSKLATLVTAVDKSQDLNGSLIDELRQLRQHALRAERDRVELDEAYRDTLAQLDVAMELSRALQEELQRLKDANAQALDIIGEYVVRFGELDVDRMAASGLPPDRNLDATIIRVRRSADQVLAEIDAGSKDGVKEGWLLTIGHGGQFIARLRITNVDINHATGIVELEDPTRGLVEVSHHVYARAGR